MKNKNDPIFLLDYMIESMELIISYIEDVTKEEFMENTQLQDSVIRRLEIIGETAKYLPNEFYEKYDNISFRDMADMRNILIHKYFGVSIIVVWKTASIEIPDIIDDIKEIRENERK